MADLLEMLWLDPTGAARARRNRAWRRLLDEGRPRAAEGPAPLPELPAHSASADDQAEVFALLRAAEPTEGDAVTAAVAAGTGTDGRFSPPLLLVEGDLSPALDELEVLRGLAANAAAFAAGDEPLQAAVAAAHAYTGLPGLVPTPYAVELHARRLREAFARIPRPVPADHLDVETRRALLEHRKLQTRTFQGAPHLRAQLGPHLAFLSPDAAPWLPLAPTFPVRALVEAHVHADPYDRSPVALAVFALARRVRRQPPEGSA